MLSVDSTRISCVKIPALALHGNEKFCVSVDYSPSLIKLKQSVRDLNPTANN
jgi:hypothetical protein